MYERVMLRMTKTHGQGMWPWQGKRVHTSAREHICPLAVQRKMCQLGVTSLGEPPNTDGFWARPGVRRTRARTQIGSPLAQSVSFVRLRAGIGYSTHALVMYQVRYETSLRPTNLYEARSGVRLGARRGGRRRVAARPFQLRNLVRSYSSAQAGWLGHSRWSCTNPHGSPTDRVPHFTAKSTCSANDPPRPPTHHSHLWASLSAPCRPARDPSAAD